MHAHSSFSSHFSLLITVVCVRVPARDFFRHKRQKWAVVLTRNITHALQITNTIRCLSLNVFRWAVSPRPFGEQMSFGIRRVDRDEFISHSDWLSAKPAGQRSRIKLWCTWCSAIHYLVWWRFYNVCEMIPSMTFSSENERERVMIVDDATKNPTIKLLYKGWALITRGLVRGIKMLRGKPLHPHEPYGAL